MSLDGTHPEHLEPDVVWLWDLTDAARRGPTPVPVVRRSPFFRYLYNRWSDNPAWHSLFWECARASDPVVQFQAIFGEAAGVAANQDYQSWHRDVHLSTDGQLLLHRPFPGPLEAQATVKAYRRGGETSDVRIPRAEDLLGIGPDAATFLTLETREQSDVVIRRRDLATGRELHRFSGPWPSASPDGRWLVAGRSTDHSMDVYDEATGRRRLTAMGDVWLLARGGRTLVTSRVGWQLPDAEVQFWDLGSGQLVATYRGQAKLQAVSADGETIAVTTESAGSQPLANWPRLADFLIRWGLWERVEEPREFTLLDAATGQVRARLPGGPGPFKGPLPGECGAAYSSDGRRLAVISTANIVRVWDWPLRRPWAFIFSFAAVPPVIVGLLILALRLLRRMRGRDPSFGRASSALVQPRSGDRQ
jgi:hypothetical protein